MSFGMLTELTIENRFVLHPLRHNNTLLAILTRKKTTKIGSLI